MTTSPTTTDAGPNSDPALARACAFLTIDLAAIAENYKRLIQRSYAAGVAAVVKADGYGLGASEVAPALVAAGARSFFVAHLDEAIALRPVLDSALPACGIFVLNGLMRGAEREYQAHQIQPVLNSLAEIEAWRVHCQARGAVLPAALHLDTGMNRLGLPGKEAQEFLGENRDLLQGMIISHVMSHLACAEMPDHPKNAEQLAAFKAASEALPRAPRSLANSSGVFLGPDYHFDLLRPGVALYGVNPTPGEANPMAQVVRLQAKILQIREIDAPQSVGYGASHLATGPARIATVGVGYADGYHRSLSNRAQAWIGHYRVPLVGRVSMDLLTFDVTGVPEALTHPGALLDLIGPDDGVDRLADEAGTIGYEILTGLGRRYHRHYLPQNA